MCYALAEIYEPTELTSRVISLSLSSPHAVMTIGGESILHSKRLYRISESYRPGDGEMICPTPADGSSTRGGSTSVSGRVRSPHISSGRPAARSQHAYSPGWDRQTDRSPYCLIPPLYGGGIIKYLVRWRQYSIDTQCYY